MKTFTHRLRRTVVSENNRRFEVISDVSTRPVTIHVDSSVFRHLKKRCDYAIQVDPVCPKWFFFIELKGNDVIKAAQQLEYTIANTLDLYHDYDNREAWVIAGGGHYIITTAFQLEKKKVMRWGFDLKYQTRQKTVDVTSNVGVTTVGG